MAGQSIGGTWEVTWEHGALQGTRPHLSSICQQSIHKIRPTDSYTAECKSCLAVVVLSTSWLDVTSVEVRG